MKAWEEYRYLGRRSQFTCVLEFLLGAWYPLAGFLVGLVTLLRKKKRPYWLAPVLGSAASLVMYVVSFVFTVIVRF